MTPKSRFEMYYIDKDGRKQDRALHEELLAGVPEPTIEQQRESMRRYGFSEESIAIILGEKTPDADRR